MKLDKHMSYWDKKAKQVLKSEMVKRGLSNMDLVRLLNEIGVKETKASVDSKISRGTFSATFLLQSLSAIGCSKLQIEEDYTPISLVAENQVEYNTNNKDAK